MARDTYFVTKTDVSEVDLLDIGGTPVVEHYEALRAALTRLAGPETAALFAEPIYRRGNGEAPASISWYAHLPDDARPLSAIEGEDRARIEQSLKKRLSAAQEALKDGQSGPLIGAALHIRSDADIWVLGDRPLIVNWGMLPSEIDRSPASRRSHFAHTLGPYLPIDVAPPISAEDMTGPFAPSAQAATPPPSETSEQLRSAVQTPSAPPPAAAPPTGTPPPPPPTAVAVEGPPPAGRPSRWRWLPLILLLLITGGVLVVLLLPGVLLYPPEPRISDQEIVSIAEENNDALRERRDRLQRALDGAVCRADGQLEFPSLPRLPSDSAARTDGEGEASIGEQQEEVVDSETLVPPRPERIEVPSDGGDSTNLIDFIEDRTALVIVEFAGSKGSGTGFFIGEDLLVTNDHVVMGPPAEQAKLGPPQAVYVKTSDSGRGLPAEILATSGQGTAFGPDFALLRVKGANAPYFPLWNSTDSIKLQQVIAAGFPGAYFAIDADRAKIYDPASPEVPDMVMTRGTVNAQQEVGPGETLAVVHSADISSGNSGGPLVDQCGRVVGVNTFGLQDATTKRFLNFSLHTTELIDFLESGGTVAESTAERCEPQVAAVPPVKRSEPEEAPAGEEEPAAGEAQPDAATSPPTEESE